MGASPIGEETVVPFIFEDGSVVAPAYDANVKRENVEHRPTHSH